MRTTFAEDYQKLDEAHNLILEARDGLVDKNVAPDFLKLVENLLEASRRVYLEL